MFTEMCCDWYNNAVVTKQLHLHRSAPFLRITFMHCLQNPTADATEGDSTIIASLLPHTQIQSANLPYGPVHLNMASMAPSRAPFRVFGTLSLRTCYTQLSPLHTAPHPQMQTTTSPHTADAHTTLPRVHTSHTFAFFTFHEQCTPDRCSPIPFTCSLAHHNAPIPYTVRGAVSEQGL